MSLKSIFGSVAVAVTALLVSSISLAEGPANNPIKIQQKYLASQIRQDAHKQSFWKNGAQPRHVQVTFSRAVNPDTGKRNGAPRATALVSAGRSWYNPRQGNPIETRNYTIRRADSGKLFARPITPWRPVYTALRTQR
jgi:hypothetical protein